MDVADPTPRAATRQPPVDDALLEGARRAVARWGWRDATLERIAAEAGVSRVTLHRRRISKQLILDAMVERALEGYRTAMWPALTEAGSGRERLERALVALLDVAEAHLPVLVALRSEGGAPFHPEGDGELLTDAPFTDPLERLLRDGAADGSLRPVDPVETATVLFNMAGWTYLHLRTAHRWDPQRARRAVLDLLIAGLVAGDD